VASIFAVNDDYFLIYPRSAEAQDQFEQNEWRTKTNQLLYDNMQFVIGFSSTDSISETVISLNVSNGEDAAIYWALSIGLIVLSVIGTHCITKWDLQRRIASQGLMQAVLDTMERFYDPDCNLHDEGDVDMLPSLLDNALFEILSVTIFGWNVAGFLLCRKAIQYTVYSAVPGWDDVEEDGGIVKDKDNIYVLWIALLITVGILLAMTAYVGRLTNAIKAARRSLFDKLKERQSQNNKETQMDDQNGCGLESDTKVDVVEMQKSTAL